MFLRSVPGGWINLTLNIIRFLAGCLRNDLNSDKKLRGRSGGKWGWEAVKVSIEFGCLFF